MDVIKELVLLKSEKALENRIFNKTDLVDTVDRVYGESTTPSEENNWIKSDVVGALSLKYLHCRRCDNDQFSERDNASLKDSYCTSCGKWFSFVSLEEAPKVSIAFLDNIHEAIKAHGVPSILNVLQATQDGGRSDPTGMSIKIEYMGRGEGFSDGHDMDQWRVKFNHKNGMNSIDYKTGLGLREFSKAGVSLFGVDTGESPKPITRKQVASEKQKKQAYEDLADRGIKPYRGLSPNPKMYDYMCPVYPRIIDVLDCLFREASVSGQSFDDWCSDYGYDSDSRKAFKTYDACLENCTTLRRFFGASFDAVGQYIQALEL